MVELATQCASSPQQPEPIRRGGDAENMRSLGGDQSIEDTERERLLVDLAESPPCGRQVDPLGDDIGVVFTRDGEGRCRLGNSHRKRLAPPLTASRVQEAVAGDSEQPGPQVVRNLRCVIEPSPRHKEDVCSDIFGVGGVHAPLREPKHVFVGVSVDRPEVSLPIWLRLSHILYLSGSALNVSLLPLATLERGTPRLASMRIGRIATEQDAPAARWELARHDEDRLSQAGAGGILENVRCRAGGKRQCRCS